MNHRATITVGDISNSYGIAIGPGARAEVHLYEGPAYPRPEYRSSVAELLGYYTRIFVGREQEVTRLRARVEEPDTGYLLVSGPAGYGKSALFASLIQQHETGLWPDPVPTLIYFFVRQQGQRHTPVDFLHGINAQLLELLQVPGGVPPDLPSLRSQFTQLWGVAIARASATQPLLLMVDGLDEMDPDPPTIADLLPGDLPPHVHVLVAARPNPDPREQVALTHPLRDAELLQLGTLDEQAVVGLLREQGASSEGVMLAPRVWQLTQGEPLLARFVSQEVAEQGEGALARLEENPPAGVDAYFRLQLKLLDSAAESELAWEILGLLVVALGGLSRAEISEMLDAPPRKVRRALEPIQRYLVGDDRVELMHQQFHAVLSEEFSHRELAALRERLLAFCARWPTHKNHYALRYFAQHLAAAAALGDDPLEWLRRLADLVLDLEFQKSHQAELNDLPALQRDLELGVQIAASVEAGAEEALFPLLRCTLGMAHFRAQQLQPEPLFQFAVEGELDLAERRLALFTLERKWQLAAQLALAWEVAASQPEAAQALLARTQPALNEDTLWQMAARVQASLDDRPPPTPSSPLPPPPTLETAQRIVGRFGGEALASGLEPLNLELYYSHATPALDAEQILYGGGTAGGNMAVEIGTGSGGDVEPVFVASLDGPYLVSYALAEPEPGDRFFEQYLWLHASNAYAYYRNVSLWLLLHAALQHPDSGWAQRMTRLVVQRALAGGEIHFQEARGYALMALLAREGDPAAEELLLARQAEILFEIDQLADERGANDAWGHHVRRLAALCEALTVLPDQEGTIELLLDRAHHLPRGYAGYMTGASLSLAESSHIARPGEGGLIVQAMGAAARSAHNIQESIFCARSTARVNAMRTHWWHVTPLPALPATIEHLAAEPGHPRFATYHIVGESYQWREQGSDNLRLPEAYRTARTLRELAALFQRSLDALERLNREVDRGVDDVLPDGTHVNIPDPDFPPLLAARLAAEALVDPTLDDHARPTLIRRLVPVAVQSPTTLDTVLARLLLATRPADPASLARFNPTPPGGPDAPYQAPGTD